MRTAAWVTALTLVGSVLSLKDADWIADRSLHNLGVLGVGAVAGGLLGFCLAHVVKPITQTRDRGYKLVLWVCAFSILGFALGHGNVPWSTTLKIMGGAAILGLIIGGVHFRVEFRILLKS